MTTNLNEQIESCAWAAMKGMDIPWMLQQWANKVPDH